MSIGKIHDANIIANAVGGCKNFQNMVRKSDLSGTAVQMVFRYLQRGATNYTDNPAVLPQARRNGGFDRGSAALASESVKVL